MSECGCGAQPRSGGAAAKKKFTKTGRKAITTTGERSVYVGVRGGQYVMINSKMVPLRDVRASKKKPKRGGGGFVGGAYTLPLGKGFCGYTEESNGCYLAENGDGIEECHCP